MNVRGVGKFIRDQRSQAQLSVRKLAQLAGVSNPYLSQIERGLRKPSAEILNGIAKALRISAETLYVKAGILEDRQGGDVTATITADPAITEKQKQALIQIYESFKAETEGRRSKRTSRAKARETDSAGGRGSKNDPKPSPGSPSSPRRSSTNEEVKR
jgi:transcriptional regulator with XRE-family HTH domain